MEISTLILLVVFLPLFGALIVGLNVRRMNAHAAHLLTCMPMVASAVCAAIVFGYLLSGPSLATTKLVLPWIDVAGFKVDWALRLDMLTAVMLIVVTWVSSVVHIYSVGYMHDDPHQPRFMAYLSLFTFCMLMLVTADNFLQLFFGWEGVGLCSYLLIGFWFKKPEANAAAIKAFLVNRVGDFGFALGICAIFLVFGTVQFDSVFTAARELVGERLYFLGYSFPTLDLICILLFIGAMGKSAQLLLHTWLPDAMEGPTPVSALIHAATMVTAGVFMVARCSPIFEYAPYALSLVTVVGACTAFFAATVGLVQNDIKRVIAYSTCSQLGYMFFACGVSAYPAAIFHLMTHAFFKALLFLGAGSVIHAMSGEQDMRRMGGIARMIPVTYAFMWIGSLALAGLPPFAGFYSKDVILEAAYAAHTPVGQFGFWMGAAAAFMTAFYSWRLLFMTFHGRPRASEEVMHHVHESPAVMISPLILLVAGALASGALGYYWLDMVNPELVFWAGAIHIEESHTALEHAHHVPLWVKILPLALGLSGIALAWYFYIANTALPGTIARRFPALYQFLLNKWYFDELYDRLFVENAKRLGRFLWRVGDAAIIDGLGVNGAAWVSMRLSERASRLQSGYLYHYAFAMLIGLLLLLGWIVLQYQGASA